MSDKTIVADGLLNANREAIMFCLSFEGDVYYHELYEGKGRRLLYELLLANSKCNLIEVKDDELDELLKNGDYNEAHIFHERREWKIALGVAAGVAILLCGVALGNAISKK